MVVGNVLTRRKEAGGYNQPMHKIPLSAQSLHGCRSTGGGGEAGGSRERFEVAAQGALADPPTSSGVEPGEIPVRRYRG